MVEPVPNNFVEETGRRLEEMAARLNDPTLRTGGPGDTSGPMDVWQQSVEGRLTELRTDLRELRNWLAGGLGFVLVALASGFMFMLVRMDAGFDDADNRIDGFDQRLDRISESQARVEALLTVQAQEKR